MTIFTAKKELFSVATNSESVKCPEQNVLSPARVTGSLSSYQIRPLHLPSWTYSLTAQFFFVSFTLFSASKFNTSLRSVKEWNGEREKENFHESPVSYTSSSQLSSPTSVLSLTSVETPAALCWLFSSNYLVGSTLTQLRLHSSSSSSSAREKARLHLWHQLLLISRMGIISSFTQIFLWHWLNLSFISSMDLWPD